MDHSLENFNVATREMTKWQNLLDRVHSSLVKTAQEAQREVVLTDQHKDDLLAVSSKILDQKAALKGTAEALKKTKEKAANPSEKVDYKAFFDQALDEQRRNNRGQQKEDEFRLRLKAVLEPTGRIAEQPLDASGNISLVVEDTHVNKRCPITLKDIVKPFRNRHCRHVFEKDAVLAHIRNIKRNGGAAACAVAGCRNKKQFTEKDFDDDPTFLLDS